MGEFLPLLVILAFLYIIFNIRVPCSFLIRSVVIEKELRIREQMSIMGLIDSTLPLSWIIVYIVLFTIVAIVGTIILYYIIIFSCNVFPKSSGGYLFLLLELYGISLTTICYWLSAFFGKAKTACIIGPVILFITFFPYYSVCENHISASGKIAASLFPSVAFSLGLNHVLIFEDSGLGITSSTANRDIYNFRFLNSYWMLIADTIIYWILGWYFDKVWPKEYGKRYNPWFIFMPSYWCSDNEKVYIKYIL